MSGDLPTGWTQTSLEEIAVINPRHPTELDDKLPVSFVPMVGLNEDKPEFQFTEERKYGEVRQGFTHFAENDVLFAKITPCMENGKGAVARGLLNKIGCGTTELHVIRLLAKITPDYIYRYLSQRAVRSEAKTHFTSSAGQARVPADFIKQLEIPLPPLTEQKRIVAKVEKLLAKVAVSRARLDKTSAILKRFRQSVLAAACSGRLTADWRRRNPNDTRCDDLVARIRNRREKHAKTPAQQAKLRDIYSITEEESTALPGGWGYVALSKLCESFDYGTSAKSKPSGKVPVLRMGNIQNGSIDWNDLVFTSDAQEIQAYSLKPSTVLFNRTNSPELVGKTSIYLGERPAIYAGYLIRVNHCPELDPRYLNLCLNTNYARAFCQSVKTDGVSQSNINAQKLGHFEVPYPPISEQLEIVRRVEELSALADRLEARVGKARGQVEKLTQSVLAKAFRGELVAQDPADEPAEKLLARIRAMTEPSATKGGKLASSFSTKRGRPRKAR